MSYKDNFNIFVGCGSGVFKGIKVAKKVNIIKNLQNLVSITEDDRVTTISWGDDNEKDVLIACGFRTNKRVKVYDTENSAFTCSFLCNAKQGDIVGISQYNGSILTAANSGEINLQKLDKESELLINAGIGIQKMRHSCMQRNIIATGGLENKLNLYDLETKISIFKEKNCSHDFLELRVPIWISDIDFLPETEQIATAGRYGHVRLYDPRAQRRPVTNISMKDQSLTCLCTTMKEKHIIVGTCKGGLLLVDLRKPGRILNTYKGFTGGVTGVACNMNNSYIASVSLDRYLRVHHLDSKELLKKLYLTSSLSCMIMRSNFCIDTEIENNDIRESSCNNSRNASKQSSKNDDISEAEYDELFDAMQVVGNKDKKLYKKRKVA